MPHSTASSLDRAHRHALRVEAGLVGHHLAQDGEQALAHLGEAGQDLEALRPPPPRISDPADVGDAVADAGVLDAAGDARAPGRLVPSRTASRVCRMPQPVVHPLAGGEEVARVEDVAVADVVAVEADPLGEPVEHALDGERGLVGAEAAHRAARRVVGVDGARLDVDVRHPVGPAGSDRRPAPAPWRRPRRRRRCRRGSAPGPRSAGRRRRADRVVQRQRVALGVDAHRLRLGSARAGPAGPAARRRAPRAAWIDRSSLPPKAPPLVTSSTSTRSRRTPSTAAIWRWSSWTP